MKNLVDYWLQLLLSIKTIEIIFLTKKYFSIFEGTF